MSWVHLGWLGATCEDSFGSCRSPLVTYWLNFGALWVLNLAHCSTRMLDIVDTTQSLENMLLFCFLLVVQGRRHPLQHRNDPLGPWDARLGTDDITLEI